MRPVGDDPVRRAEPPSLSGAKTKGPAIGQGLSSLQRELLSNDADILAVVRAFNFELDLAFGSSEQGVIFTTTNVRTSVELGATLTNNNATSQNSFTTETLHAKAFGFGVTTVAGRTASLFMCHLMVSSVLGSDASDFDFSEPLTVAHLFTVMLTTTELDDLDLFATAMSHNFSQNFTASNVWRTDFHFFALGNHQNFIKFNGNTGFSFQLLQADNLAFSYTVLLAAT
jgi:hypothetical protein